MNLDEITIEITQKCPNRCIYCSSFSGPDMSEGLDYATVCRVINEAKSLGVKRINVSGGEPFLHPNIVEIVDQIYSIGLKAFIYSSGIYFADNNSTSIPEYIFRSIVGKIEGLIINYETIDPTLYATIMGTVPGNHTYLSESIRRAISWGIPVEAHFVPMRCNFRQIPAVMEELIAMGVRKISILRLVRQGRATTHGDLIDFSTEDHAELVQVLRDCKKQYRGAIRIGMPLVKGRPICYTGTSKLDVRYDGFVFPCEAFKDGMMDIEGDVPRNVKNASLEEIYSSSSYLCRIRLGLAKYKESDTSEPCYGQFFRNKSSRREKRSVTK